MSITRATGDLITANLGYKAFCDESAHNYKKPVVEVMLIDSDERQQGMGRHHGVKYDEEGRPTHFIKRLIVTDALRITAIAKADETGSSERNCIEMMQAIRGLFRTLRHGKAAMPITDPITHEDMCVQRGFTKIGDVTGARLNSHRQPISHEATIDITLQRRAEMLEPVERVIEHVTIKHEVANG